MTDSLARLSEVGVSIWLDDLGRARLTGGSLAHLVAERYVTGVTTNPSIFAAAIAGSDAYDEALGELALRRVGHDEALRAITTADVRAACDVLRPVYEATGGVDGYVSIEVDPRLAHDTARTVAEAKALWWLVDRPNLFVKIPAAKQGLPAITACLAAGISINVTLIFSVSRYGEVAEAFLTGMCQARGHPAAVADHGEIPEDSITDRYDDARQVLDELATVGVDYDEVVQTLEGQGVGNFDAAWEELGQRLRRALARRPSRRDHRDG